MTPERAALVVIGDEVRTGKIADSNGPWLARELHALGLDLWRAAWVGDDVGEIAEVVGQLARRATVVFTSGGIGPTHDDVTYLGVATALGVPLVRDPALEAHLRERYGDRLTPERLRMAEVPRPDEICQGPGFLMPVVRVQNVYVLPGVPMLFRQLFGGLRERFRRAPVFYGHLCTSLSEGRLVAQLDAVVAAHPEVAIGSYPCFEATGYRTKLTVEARAPEAVQRALDALTQALGADQVVELQPPAPVQPPPRE